MTDDRRGRRWIGWVVLAAGLAVVLWILPRLLPRSPAVILAASALSVLAMWLVEQRIRAWFRRRDARRVAAASRP